MEVIVDTNVAMVAQGLATHADQTCIDECNKRLVELVMRGHLLVDEGDEIVGEYMNNLTHAGRPGVGRAFAKWAWDNRFNEERVRRIAITPTSGRGWRRYKEFPNRANLSSFHSDDQKFVAVAVACGRSAPILNAVDSDWRQHHAALLKANVKIEFLCPQHVESP